MSIMQKKSEKVFGLRLPAMDNINSHRVIDLLCVKIFIFT